MITKTKTSKKRHNPNHKARPTAKVFQINTDSVTELQKVINAAWAFAAASLWNRQQFSENETMAAKIIIGSYFVTETDKDAALHQFCQRILLARKFILPAFETLPIPSLWFDENNANGYEATSILFYELVRQRRSEPLALPEFTLTADGITSFSKEPSTELYQSIRQELLITKAPEMALLFQLFAANLLYEQY